ncbi:hypothetical protein PtA15_18A166 [Puccinia triticina]|uniref:RRM domain-containing protein n=1 Tax=Puccinia triticina TaxID=208348 RepID=A0ABY7D7Q3_9BASI|nr:uncharacterized protein PtA15_18A166 [Puccinia triticina]WAQ93108.1 hypothetical protein PtA15_18A166 [Puccinia triticina]
MCLTLMVRSLTSKSSTVGHAPWGMALSPLPPVRRLKKLSPRPTKLKSTGEPLTLKSRSLLPAHLGAQSHAQLPGLVRRLKLAQPTGMRKLVTRTPMPKLMIPHLLALRPNAAEMELDVVEAGEVEPAVPLEERASKPRSTRTRSRRGKAPVAAASVDGVKRERRPRRKGPPEGEPSQTSLFVANLPFDVTDEKLKEFFASYEVVSAHVVSRRYGSSTGRSKGFGFVEFANEENQLKALEEIQGKEMDGRALHVKIAINEAKKDAEEAADKDTGAPASVPAEPAAA